jgi:hypothetical protein
VKFNVFTAVTTKIVFQDVMPYSLIDVYQHFEGTCCLHLQSRKGSHVWKTVVQTGRGMAGMGVSWDYSGFMQKNSQNEYYGIVSQIST